MTAQRPRRIRDLARNTNASVAHVIDIAIHGSDHNVLRHILQSAECLFGLHKIMRGGHFPRSFDQAEFVGIRDGGGVCLAVFVCHDRAMVGGLDAHVLEFHLAAGLDGDALRADLQGAPLVLELVLAVLYFFFVDVGGVGTPGGHGDREVPAVAKRGERLPENGGAGEGQVAAVDAHFIEADFAVPGEMRIDHRDVNVQHRA